nr:MAG TPA: hypothetical protein [Caudoviricetes sp.]
MHHYARRACVARHNHFQAARLRFHLVKRHRQLMAHVFRVKFADKQQMLAACARAVKFGRFHQLQAGMFLAKKLPHRNAVRFGVDFGCQKRVQCASNHKAVRRMYPFALQTHRIPQRVQIRNDFRACCLRPSLAARQCGNADIWVSSHAIQAVFCITHHCHLVQLHFNRPACRIAFARRQVCTQASRCFQFHNVKAVGIGNGFHAHGMFHAQHISAWQIISIIGNDFCHAHGVIGFVHNRFCPFRRIRSNRNKPQAQHRRTFFLVNTSLHIIQFTRGKHAFVFAHCVARRLRKLRDNGFFRFIIVQMFLHHHFLSLSCWCVQFNASNLATCHAFHIADNRIFQAIGCRIVQQAHRVKFNRLAFGNGFACRHFHPAKPARHHRNTIALFIRDKRCVRMNHHANGFCAFARYRSTVCIHAHNHASGQAICGNRIAFHAVKTAVCLHTGKRHIHLVVIHSHYSAPFKLALYCSRACAADALPAPSLSAISWRCPAKALAFACSS